MSDTHKPGKRRAIGVVRERLSWIEDQQEAGWDREAIIAKLEAETGVSLTFETFKKYLYRARKRRREQGEKWIAQSTNTPPAKPEVDPQQSPTPRRSAPKYEPTDDAEEKKRRLREASRCPLPDVSGWLDKPRKTASTSTKEDGDQPSPVSHEPDQEDGHPKPWKRKKEINPLLLALKAKQDQGKR